MEATQVLYRLEFNEEQQVFHMEMLSPYAKEANTHGWFTITEYCSDIEFNIFEAYVNKTKHERLTKEFLLRCITEIAGFMNNLSEYNLVIKKMIW